MNVEAIMDWERLGAVTPDALSDARLELHWAAQLPAAFGASWAPEEPEFAHMALGWARGLRAMASAPSRGVRAALLPEELALVLLDAEARETARLPLGGRNIREGLAWLAEHGPGGRGDLALPAHELPAHAVGGGAVFAASGRRAERAELARWYANTDRLLRGLGRQAKHASPARLWPHHFDLATLVRLDPTEKGEDARSIGVGMTPGDDSYPEPYWYVTPWPYPAAERLGALDGDGRWHTEGWTGAVLRASALADGASAQDQAGQVIAFVHSALNASWAALEPRREEKRDG